MTPRMWGPLAGPPFSFQQAEKKVVDAVAEMIEDRLIDVDEIARAIADTTDVGSEGDSNSAQPKVRNYKFRKLHNDA